MHSPYSRQCLDANAPARQRLAFDELVSYNINQILSSKGIVTNNSDEEGKHRKFTEDGASVLFPHAIVGNEVWTKALPKVFTFPMFNKVLVLPLNLKLRHVCFVFIDPFLINLFYPISA